MVSGPEFHVLFGIQVVYVTLGGGGEQVGSITCFKNAHTQYNSLYIIETGARSPQLAS